jgi:hypothetical protein
VRLTDTAQFDNAIGATAEIGWMAAEVV